MDFVQIATTILEFLQAHLLGCAAVLAVAVAYFFHKNPVEAFKFLAFIVIMAIIGYLILQIGSSSDSGLSAKGELTHKTKRALGE